MAVLISQSVFFLMLIFFAVNFLRENYLDFIRLKYLNKIEWVLLEVRLPRDVMRSPEAMELVLNALYQGGGVGTWYDVLVKGQLLQYFSLEIVSFEGAVRFYIRTPIKFKDLIRSQIYAYYSLAEVYEVEDYVKAFPLYSPKDSDWDLFGSEFVLTDPDPYPIKTYIDYGLDKSVGKKEDEKVDPLSTQIEFMGSLGRGEQLWTQIMVRKSSNRFFDPSYRWWNPKTWFNKQNWVAEGKDTIKKVLKDFGADDGEKVDTSRLTSFKKDIITAIERSINKPGFDCGIRVIYLAKKDYFKPERIPALLGLYRPYGSTYLNGFKPVGSSIPAMDYPWQDRTQAIKNERKLSLQFAYINRGYFYPPYKKTPFVLNTEELATIYHFPGRLVTSPGLDRAGFKTVEPPNNLPV